MSDEQQENELPPEKPALRMGLKGYAIALLGVIIVGLVIGAVLRVWG